MNKLFSLFERWPQAPEFNAPNVSSARINLVFLITGTAGFLLGLFIYPTLQHAVEGAQAVSGIVQYTAPSPFYDYQIQLWTVSHQLLALLLKAGLSERTLCLLTSGFLGMISFSALGLATLAVSEDTPLAILLPFWIHLSQSVKFGVVYVIQLLGTFTTYGVLGLSYIVLTASLIALRRNRLGYLLLGLAPAVHPSLGSYLCAVILGVHLLNRRIFRAQFEVAWGFLTVGIFLTAGSFVCRYFSAHSFNFFYQESAPYVSQFVKYWCGHRGPVDITTPGFTIQILTMLIGFLAISLFKNTLSRTSFFLLLCIIVSGLLSTPLAFLSWIPPQYLPDFLLAPMPARYLNFNIFLLPSVLIGLMAREKHNIRMQILILFTFLSVGKLARNFNLHPEWTAYELIALGVVWLVLKWFYGAPREVSRSKAYIFRRISFGVLVFVAVKLSVMLPDIAATYRPEFSDKKDTAFWSRISQDKGMLLTSYDLNLVQLKSRRPVLLDIASVDGLPYAPQSGPFMNEILRDLYQADLLKTPKDDEEPFIDEQALQISWESRTATEWHALAKKYSFTQILTNAEWHLQLPIEVQNDDYILYQA